MGCDSTMVTRVIPEDRAWPTGPGKGRVETLQALWVQPLTAAQPCLHMWQHLHSQWGWPGCVPVNLYVWTQISILQNFTCHKIFDVKPNLGLRDAPKGSRPNVAHELVPCWLLFRGWKSNKIKGTLSLENILDWSYPISLDRLPGSLELYMRSSSSLLPTNPTLIQN